MSTEERHFLNLLQKHLQGTLTSTECEELMLLAKNDSDKAILLDFLKIRQGDSEKNRLEAEIIYEKNCPNDLHPFIPLKDDKKYPSIRRSRYRYMAIAAIFICLLGVLVALRARYYEKTTVEWESMMTNKGERKFFRMSDGTEIWLNSGSVLRVRKGYGKKHRIMTLEGEAYFSVAKNRDLPLRVKTMGAEIEVLGTIFNVKAYPEDHGTETSLIEGSVKLHVDSRKGRKDYVLKPGDKVEVLKQHPPKEKGWMKLQRPSLPPPPPEVIVDYKKIFIQNEEPLELMWIENKLVFNGDAFESVVRKLERWYNRTIVIVNNNLKEESFTGIFQEQTCEQVLDLLQRTDVQFNYKVENGIIYLK